MPVSALYVEGKLDMELLAVIFAGPPVVQRRGTKYGLQGIVVRERDETGNPSIFFLRDRDFDFEPEDAAPHQPAPIHMPRSGMLVGWHWFRHSIECYLLEPALAAAALQRPQAELENLLREGGKELINYQAARWAIGQVRSKLPPSRHLLTHPPELNDEFDLPQDFSEQANRKWLLSSCEEFIGPVGRAFSENSICLGFNHYRAKFSSLDTAGILVWFSGKDLLSFLAPRIGKDSPAQIRNHLRDWVRSHPDVTLVHLPEWAALKQLLSQ
jgi:hypothetical protein